jgi:hypothetical protein
MTTEHDVTPPAQEANEPKRRKFNTAIARGRGAKVPGYIGEDANRVRHETRCNVCRHPQRDEIERDFIDWISATEIATTYGFKDKSSIYRHARSLGLVDRRIKNVRFALMRLIEQVAHVPANSNSIVAACVALSKINSEGRYVDRKEVLNLAPVFERMTAQELEEYASSGTLPPWAQVEVKAGE